MKKICGKYRGHELTLVCMFFAPGGDYTCLNKGITYRVCPWVGKPFPQPTGYFLSPKDLVQTAWGVGDLSNAE